MYHISSVSSNKKVGPIPVTTSSAETCPSTCPFKKGCYAKSGPLAIHWAKVTKSERGGDWNSLVSFVRSLPKDQLWRHNQAGDLPSNSLGNNSINAVLLYRLVEANKGRKGFTYTHKPVENHKQAEANKEAIKYCNENGFTVNLSANNIKQADRYIALGIAPVTVVIQESSPKHFSTPAGNKVVTCPSQLNKNLDCNRCRLCQKADRDFIIGFRAHGSGKKSVEEIVKED